MSDPPCGVLASVAWGLVGSASRKWPAPEIRPSFLRGVDERLETRIIHAIVADRVVFV